MLDLINRQAAIDALNEQIEYCNKALGSFDISPKDEYAVKVERASLEVYKEQLENLSSAQPEIIRCKKCEHWTRTCGDEQWGLGDCDVFDKHLVMCNGYCAWAERRTDD